MVKGRVNALGISNIDNSESGSGYKFFVTNDSGTTYNKGDKVLVNAGLNPQDLSRGFSIRPNSEIRDYGLIFTDNETALVYFVNAMRKYVFTSNSWSEIDISTWGYSNNAGGFTTFKNGLIRLGENANTSTPSSLITSNGRIELPSSGMYLGEYNGQSYAYDMYNKKVFKYDLLSNTLGDTVLTNSHGGNNGSICYLDSQTGKGFTVTRMSCIQFFDVDENGTFTENNYINLNVKENEEIVGYTGADVGDYIFFATNCFSRYYINNTTAIPDSYLRVYKIVETLGKRYLELQNNMFKSFQVEDCYAKFDLRNDVLTVGTRNNVYAYKYHRDTKSFEELNTDFNLVANSNKYFSYRLAFSPDMSKALVTLRSETYLMDVTLYTLGSSSWKIVSNQKFNYNSTNSFTGFATGNVDSEGKVEVDIVLPETINLNIVTDVNVASDEIVVEGVK